MIWAMMIWANLVTVAGGVAIYLTQRANLRAERVREDQLTKALLSRRPSPPVVVPAPDLSPLLTQLTEMSVTMARELASGISLIVQGPPSPSPAQTAGEAPAEPLGEDTFPVEYPPWETDPSWGVFDNQEHDGQWSAHTEPEPVTNWSPDIVISGNGVIRRDGTPMFGSASLLPNDE